MNDFWQSDGVNWTYLGGSTNFSSTAAVYGVKGVASTLNNPGCRGGGIAWTDSQNTLWLFGGWGFATSSTQGYLDDIWKSNGTHWTWVAGSNNTNQKSVLSGSANPGGRFKAVSWYVNNRLWMYGGEGYGSTGSNAMILQDLWYLQELNWTYVGGSTNISSGPNYGIMAVSSSSNWPGSRSASVSWSDSVGTLYLLGGRSAFSDC